MKNGSPQDKARFTDRFTNMGIVTKYVPRHIQERKNIRNNLFCTPQTLGQQLQSLAFFDKKSVVRDMVKCFL